MKISKSLATSGGVNIQEVSSYMGIVDDSKGVPGLSVFVHFLIAKQENFKREHFIVNCPISNGYFIPRKKVILAPCVRGGISAFNAVSLTGATANAYTQQQFHFIWDKTFHVCADIHYTM